MRFRSSGAGWRGGGAGCRLLLAGLPQLRTSLLTHGFTDDDLTATAAALADPRLLLNGFLFTQTSGRLTTAQESSRCGATRAVASSRAVGNP
ncbi:hypothetical protein [Actinoplanes friuliensis]|uniref:Uncharacterized protein n=1 Tax=Actinoplanes friuliensis DSM 7358 TaxID=1246995 RepID=U5VVY7_9ACTN|nr:hypothetical protein [Actinoplanes friuliensis]AGZ41128.1 hypothetical protein AFR_14230 [Actinoplanes friuliensis DSM 7358]